MTALAISRGRRWRPWLPGIVADEPLLFVFAGLLGSAYAVFALIRHAHFQTGLDLAIFDQAIWHYSRFEAPESTVAGLPNLLGDHFHPILVVLAPLYWVWSDSRVLLLAQAGLVAASVVPVFLFARPRLGRSDAYLLAATYGTFWGLQAGVGYDFHEVAFAPLLIALAIWAIDARRWKTYVVSVALLLMVKEDLSVFVAFLGIYLLSMRKLKAGALTFIAGIAGYELATTVIIPHFALSGHFNYWTFTQLGTDLPDALLHILRRPWKPFEVAFSNHEKVQTLSYLWVSFIGLTLCSRVALLAVPLVAERFLSTSPQFWTPNFHYSMAIAPVLAMGAAAGLSNVAALLDSRWRKRVLISGALGTLIAATLVARFVPSLPIRQVFRPGFLPDPAYGRPLRDALARVPRGDSVMAQDALVPHLAHRKVVVEIQSSKGVTDYLVTNVLEPVGGPGPAGSYRALEAEVVKRLGYYTPIYYKDGWLVGRRGLAHSSSRSARPVLLPMAAAQAQQLLASAIAWEPARASALTDVSRCSKLTHNSDPAATACWQRAAAEFRKLEPRIEAQLASTPATLRGGCRQLASAAATGVTDFHLDIDQVRQAGLHGSKSQLIAARTRLSRDTEERDLAGRFQRFMVLCTRPKDILAAIRRAQHPR